MKDMITKYPFLKEIGITQPELKGAYYGGQWKASGTQVEARNPGTGQLIAKVTWAGKEDYEAAVKVMLNARDKWMDTPAPARGEVVRQLG